MWDLYGDKSWLNLALKTARLLGLKSGLSVAEIPAECHW